MRNEPPKDEQEWIDERSESTQDDFEELIKDIEELVEADYDATIADFEAGYGRR